MQQFYAHRWKGDVHVSVISIPSLFCDNSINDSIIYTFRFPLKTPFTITDVNKGSSYAISTLRFNELVKRSTFVLEEAEVPMQEAPSEHGTRLSIWIVIENS